MAQAAPMNPSSTGATAVTASDARPAPAAWPKKSIDELSDSATTGAAGAISTSRADWAG